MSQLLLVVVVGARSPIEWQPVIASPQSSSKDGRATDSCFALIGAHQCGVLMVDVWRNTQWLLFNLLLLQWIIASNCPLASMEWGPSPLLCCYQQYCPPSTVDSPSTVPFRLEPTDFHSIEWKHPDGIMLVSWRSGRLHNCVGCTCPKHQFLFQRELYAAASSWSVA